MRIFETDEELTEEEISTLLARAVVEQLQFHQLRLLAASLRREIRQLQKVKEPHRHTQRLASMTESTRSVISRVRDV